MGRALFIDIFAGSWYNKIGQSAQRRRENAEDWMDCGRDGAGGEGRGGGGSGRGGAAPRRADLLADRDRPRVPAANAAVAEARDRVLACSAALPAGQKEIVSLACVTAESVTLWNEIGAWLTGPREENPELAARLEHWYAVYLTQWRQVSRESGLPNLTRLIVRYADLLRDRQYRKV